MGDASDDVHSKTESRSQYRIDSTALHSKVISTTLRYTPVALAHHIPLKLLPSGKSKAPSMTPKLKALLKLVLSYFYNVLQLLDQNTDEETLTLALGESGKLIPYIKAGGSNKKAMKTFMKVRRTALIFVFL
jgi:nucleolar complex protein 2